MGLGIARSAQGRVETGAGPAHQGIHKFRVHLEIYQKWEGQKRKLGRKC